MVVREERAAAWISSDGQLEAGADREDEEATGKCNAETGVHL